MGSDTTILQSDVLKSFEIPHGSGRCLAEAACAEEGTAQANESCSLRGLQSWGISHNRRKEHVGDIPIGTRNGTSFLRIGIQPLFRGYCSSKIPSCGISGPTLFISTPLGTTYRSFPSRGNRRSRLKGESAVKWRDSSGCGKRSLRNSVQLIIQNNFHFSSLCSLGNLEASEAFGRVNFVMRTENLVRCLCPQALASPH